MRQEWQWLAAAMLRPHDDVTRQGLSDVLPGHRGSRRALNPRHCLFPRKATIMFSILHGDCLPSVAFVAHYLQALLLRWALRHKIVVPLYLN